jgi:heme/copper-type cytochrome/quinol oxidase subunit 2
MKKIISVTVFAFLVLSLFSVNGVAADKKTQATVSKSAKVEVYYFHFTRRCVTCQAVETESQAAIAALYPVQAKKGLITFKAVNLDEKTSSTLAKKCNAEGQALLVIGAGKRIDLTEKGFMYAKSSPDKLKAELKKVIDPLL